MLEKCLHSMFFYISYQVTPATIKAVPLQLLLHDFIR